MIYFRSQNSEDKSDINKQKTTDKTSKIEKPKCIINKNPKKTIKSCKNSKKVRIPQPLNIDISFDSNLNSDILTNKTTKQFPSLQNASFDVILYIQFTIFIYREPKQAACSTQSPLCAVTTS